MSEESKTSDSDYVHMNDGRAPNSGAPSNNAAVAGLDDPNLSQEDRDLRLAIALQQQENAAAYDAHKKRHDAAIAANTNRTSRSNVHSRLAQVRKKDHGMLTVPDEYTTENAYKKGDSEYVSPAADGSAVVANATANGALPQEVADLKMALDLQKVEQTGAGTAQTMNKILKEEKDDEEANDMRTARSGKAAFHPVRGKKQ
mmetsp:Transcript_9462/g.17073  ORF Transcript_9462/g.17073 Transcript_9462/m.17073 type:complete len:201 (-) Transcript_9462:179-781(-)|eukprot:CAMPEP_0201608834 /NCGR_PEP_ID=MMETSP0492-20130828/9209_1 /ASSEMBLY_ACC=CAM_ASM_000837 /TAXON_ID=420259 /ORGANISM="Thalassiosira gravida, Strain GMp14c1" /LENGTH=200 /DNA_ID=CAMNT_0048073839 /DNA_START=68 /DNA_END=670 /DNA_ORIENTATION=+